MNKLVTLVEINIFDKMLPLASGYLQSYASKDSRIKAAYEFGHYTTSVSQPYSKIAGDLSDKNAFLYGISCYVWNMGLVKSVVSSLLATNPDAYILLGGPQVMRYAEKYLDPQHEHLIICNGEGEKTFRNVLLQLLGDSPDFSEVRGLSFYRDGELITTEPEDRIQSLEELPSPFLTGVFKSKYRMAVLETNRGCPFRCTFCFWGAATNDRVYKFDEDRIREEITWLSQNQVALLLLADANWGMLKRDIEISKHIADCKRLRGAPFYVYFSAAKNSPDRVSQIANILHEGGMLNTQPISMQSLDQQALEYSDRKNIKLSAYENLQQELNRKGISSNIELIWPLPGETLHSFKTGIEKLCGLDAAHIIVFPHMMLHNTPLSRRKEELGIVTRVLEDGVSEAELIIKTSEVGYEDFKNGLRFYYAVLALHNTHLIKRTASFLHHNHIMPYASLLSSFAEFVYTNTNNGFKTFCEESIENADFYQVSNYPTIYHLVLHRYRQEFEKCLYDFLSTQLCWSDPRVRFLFEIDMLTKPYIYSNTPLDPPVFDLEFVTLLGVSDRVLTVEIPQEHIALIENKVDTLNNSDPRVFQIDHKRSQFPFKPRQSREENASYCSGVVIRISSILPKWKQPSSMAFNN